MTCICTVTLYLDPAVYSLLKPDLVEALPWQMGQCDQDKAKAKDVPSSLSGDNCDSYFMSLCTTWGKGIFTLIHSLRGLGPRSLCPNITVAGACDRGCVLPHGRQETGKEDTRRGQDQSSSQGYAQVTPYFLCLPSSDNALVLWIHQGISTHYVCTLVSDRLWEHDQTHSDSGFGLP